MDAGLGQPVELADDGVDTVLLYGEDELLVVAVPRTDVAGFVGFAAKGPLHVPVRIVSFAQFQAIFGGHIREGYLAYAVEGFFANWGRVCWIVRVDDAAAARTASLVLGDGSTPLLQLTATSPGRWGDQLLVRAVGGTPARPSLSIKAPDGTEQFLRDPVGDLDAARAARGHRAADREITEIDLELLVHVGEPEAGTAGTVLPFDRHVALSGGRDGIETVRPGHFSGDGSPPERTWGIAALAAIDEVALIAAPDLMPKPPVPPPRRPPPPPCGRLDADLPAGWMPPAPLAPPAFGDGEIENLQKALLTHCVRCGDRVAILDVPPEARLPEQAADWRRRFQDADGARPETSFAALYYPWILVNDPLELDGLMRLVPPSGHVAGVYARVDLTQGVHQAPANEVVEGARDLALAVDSQEHGDLNSENVNVIREFPGGGIRIAGGRTLYQAPLLRYVNVRRLLLMIEEAIEEQSQWIVFEPNDTILRAETDRVIRSFLELLFHRGMLAGRSATEAYSVQCDGRNNPREETDAGRLICDVGVQPPWPAEFVVIRIGRTQSSTEVIEERSAEPWLAPATVTTRLSRSASR